MADLVLVALAVVALAVVALVLVALAVVALVLVALAVVALVLVALVLVALAVAVADLVLAVADLAVVVRRGGLGLEVLVLTEFGGLLKKFPAKGREAVRLVLYLLVPFQKILLIPL
jgi:hypothetical protein